MYVPQQGSSPKSIKMSLNIDSIWGPSVQMGAISLTNTTPILISPDILVAPRLMFYTSFHAIQSQSTYKYSKFNDDSSKYFLGNRKNKSQFVKCWILHSSK